MFPTVQLRKVLDNVHDQISPGWYFSTYLGHGDTLWSTYRDAEITTGIVGLQLQIYIHVPTYELATQHYIELTTADVKDCLETHSKLYRFRTPIAKSYTRRSRSHERSVEEDKLDDRANPVHQK